MTGLPSKSATHPGGSVAPTLWASAILLPAMGVVAASNSRGGSFLAGGGKGERIGTKPGFGTEGRDGGA